MSDKRSLGRQIRKVAGTRSEIVTDRIHGPETARQEKTIAITMRTPGHDRELATGFLVGEGLLRSLDEVEAVYSRGPRYGDKGWQHRVRVTLRPEVPVDLVRLERNFYTTSSCGVCGKTSIEALEMSVFPPLIAATWQVTEAVIYTLPARLREAQAVFEETGGLHAAGLFTPAGRPLIVREDVGRHNAVDKVIGAQFLSGKGPLSNCLLVVSGRASFELMQKAIASGIPMLVAVGAPSSLAVEVAEKFGATLIGFTKAHGFNIYTGENRVQVGVDETVALKAAALA
jgi:FdhD protein